MLEGMTNEEKALAEQIINNMRGERQITTSTQVSSPSVTAIAKGDRFLKSASRRQRKVLESLDLIANLSVTSRYAYDKEQAENLIESLEERVACIKVLFERGVARQEKKADEEE